MFEVGGVDVTTQSVKETQALIDEKLGISPQILTRTMFHGQHSLNEILETTDAKLKEELSLVVPLALWQEAAKLARARSREAARKASELTGMISLRNGDVEKLRIRREDAEGALRSMQEDLNILEAQLEDEVTRLGGSEVRVRSFEVEFNTLELQVHETAEALKDVESKQQILQKQRDDDVGPLERSYVELSKSRSLLVQRCQNSDAAKDLRSLF